MYVEHFGKARIGGYEGEFHHTVGYTDVATGWSEFRPLKTKGQHETTTALESVMASLPFPVLGLDSDNGSEFLNWHPAKFCADRGIQLTRCRPYHKNDQCRIEQKNGAIDSMNSIGVRGLITASWSAPQSLGQIIPCVLLKPSSTAAP